jgi:putative membrane protein insertion efficiency factor
MKKIAIIAIKMYTFLIKPILGSNCRYYPSCSEYTKAAIERHGLAKGVIFGVKRLIKCNQLFPGGYDPVPEIVSRGTICSN